MKSQVQKMLQEILQDMGISDTLPDVTISDDPSHGEYTTNIAMRLSKHLKKSPMVIAQELAQKIRKPDLSLSPKSSLFPLLQAIDRVDIAPPGFINFFVTEAALSTKVSEVLKDGESYGTTQSKKSDGVMVEYGDPNTHKAFHIGHLRNISIGESVSRILAAAGSEVIHVSYQGDVGMHIAKCLYGMLRIPEFGDRISEIRKKDIHEKVDFIAKAYAAGSQAFEGSDEVKKQVGDINKKIYSRHPEIYPLYQETRQWSLEYFEKIYQRVGTSYKRNYFESEVYEIGKKNVLDGLKKGIFEESDGAIIFPGDTFGLHKRVFITKEGNPTYEGKDMGLGPLEYGDLTKWTKQPKLVIRIVGPEQAGYFQVVFEAHSQLFPQLRDTYYHLIAGWVKLKQGKMSSRTGQVVLGEWLLDEAKRSIYEILSRNKTNYTKEEQDEIAEKAAVAAVKYAFLRVGTQQEISFDVKESVSFDGDSGPYLLYTYARCRSVFRKASLSNLGSLSDLGNLALNPEEKSLARQIFFFPEIVSEAAHTLSPNILCTYLFKLAQSFNVFYQKHPILGQPHRLALTAATAQVLKNGLYLLGIETVERM